VAESPRLSQASLTGANSVALGSKDKTASFVDGITVNTASSMPLAQRGNGGVLKDKSR